MKERFNKWWEERGREKASLTSGSSDPVLLQRIKLICFAEYQRGFKDGVKEQIEKN